MGYDVARFIQQVPEKFMCPICSEVLDDPQECCICQNVLCKICLEDCLLRKPNFCPINNCQEPNFKRTHPWIRSEINQLELKCTYCDLIISIENLHKHEDECENQFIQCTHCTFQAKRLLVRQHEENCDMKQIQCPNCLRQITQKDVKSHECINIHVKKYVNFLFQKQQIQLENQQQQIGDLKALISKQQSIIENLQKEILLIKKPLAINQRKSDQISMTRHNSQCQIPIQKIISISSSDKSSIHNLITPEDMFTQAFIKGIENCKRCKGTGFQESEKPCKKCAKKQGICNRCFGKGQYINKNLKLKICKKCLQAQFICLLSN